MRRLAAAALLALALGVGTASADTFAVVPDRPDNFVVVPEGPVVVPSAEVPNEPGSILLPPGVWDAPFLAAPEVSYEELEALWARAGAAYGIPWQVLAAINKIESNFGRNMGPSSAGAVGWMQFMPDTWLRWGTDGDGDGVVDPWDPEDAVFAAARYLAASGGAHDISGAVFSYNHAQWYVNEVLGLASLFGGDVDVVFTLDKLAVRLEEAQTAVAETSKALEEAESAAADLESRLAALDERAGLPGQLLSDRLDVEKEAFEVGQASTAAGAEVERLQAELTTAEAVLEQARSGAHAASFHPAAAGILGGPSRSDGYVFPVGGGAQFVSVGHTHHDYPAADIAAQEGSPVYALADAIVLDAVDDGTCGIGILLQTGDGLQWVYCHLSQRDPAVVPGAVLFAGQWVGFVGSTGHSTGPHLHLALKPETSYPQDMTWFEEFAGTAFTWQDSPAGAYRSTPVFSVVPFVESDDDVVEFTIDPSRG